MSEDLITHDHLVTRAERWLRGTVGCAVTFNDRIQPANCEYPDAIGWRDGVSIVIECKVSRSDFIRDRKKLRHKVPEMGMGAHRLFMVPPRLIAPEELLDGWGLLYCHPSKIKRVVCPKGNMHWGTPHFIERNRDAELRLLLSALRRVDRRGLLDLVYEPIDSNGPEPMMSSQYGDNSDG
jgi:hypothetical protein